MSECIARKLFFPATAACLPWLGLLDPLMASSCPLPAVGADVIRSATGPTRPADTLRPLLVVSFRNSMHLHTHITDKRACAHASK